VTTPGNRDATTGRAASPLPIRQQAPGRPGCQCGLLSGVPSHRRVRRDHLRNVLVNRERRELILIPVAGPYRALTCKIHGPATAERVIAERH
jgi:hypothetical protein